MKSKVFKSIIYAVIGVFIISVLATICTDTESVWYTMLNKPSIQPPPIVFPIVWTIVYILYAASLSLVLINDGDYLLFAIQGILNVLWCLFFFIFKLPIIAFLILFVYFIVSFLTIIRVFKVNKLAGALLIPVQLWLTFALVINYLVVILN